VERLAAAAGAVDVLVNCAGIAVRTPIFETAGAGLQQVIAVDLVGVLNLTRLVARGMVARGSGVVIGAENRGVYAAPKAAIS
jgi:NAD(P)-dependent dehydrogenase (short-subunit alcohol dehydrogenase family)